MESVSWLRCWSRGIVKREAGWGRKVLSGAMFYTPQVLWCYGDWDMAYIRRVSRHV